MKWLMGMLLVLMTGQLALTAPAVVVRTKLVPVCVTALYQGCGLVDREGNWRVRPWYSEIHPNGEGWTVRRHSGLTGWLDADGRVVITPRFESIAAFVGGLAPAKLYGEDAKYGYIDASGRWVIQPRFDQAEKFSEGLASVRWTEGGRERSGYLNPQGQLMFSTPEATDQPFVDGRTTVMGRTSDAAPTICKGIDRTGRELIRITGQDSCNVTVVAGGGWILDSDDSARLVDRHLKTLLKVQGEEAHIHGDPEGRPATGLGVFGTGSGEGLIDLRTGRVLIAPRQGQFLGFHGEGRVSYQEDRNGETVYGFLDYSGRPVIPAQYASSDQFWSGRAVVTTADEAPVVLNLKGEELSSFKVLRPVSIDLDPWKDDVQSPVRRDVAQVITDEQEDVWTDLDGRPFLRVRGSKRCAIDEVFNQKGQQIWPADSAAVCRVNGAGLTEHDKLSGTEKALLAHKHAFEHERLDDEALLHKQGKVPVFERMMPPEQRRMGMLVRNAAWLDGPRELSLGQGVRLSLPAGHRYLPPEAVLALRRGLRAEASPAAPEAAQGERVVSTAWILGPHEHWRTEVSVVGRGYLALDAALPSPDELLDTMKLYTTGRWADGASSSVFQSLSWLRLPELDRARARLTYGFSDSDLEAGGRQDTLNVALFGRSQVVVLSTVWHSPFQLQHFELFQGDVLKFSTQIQFLPGHRHQDYQQGDAVAPVALETLITGPQPEHLSRLGESIGRLEQKRQNRINGRLLGLLVILVAAALMLTTRFSRRRLP
ncbi:hypothetical protein E7T06_12620 [Deinococcus sp. Arct2-2]|uniref:WG repeat-containing protein n=1 Tax=Deinococcus sp. Arct2-2 TaxID=2568653 RepID=UPI0010A306F1|nr:WG repeat-containing protein [Deinococcus sp. Arct2-2]THF69325.1 hypothetical protein E7T06_12620 [Deinococcus sp. Arct2-2]